MMEVTARPKAATIADLERSELYRLLQRSLLDGQRNPRSFMSPDDIIASPLADCIVQIYSSLFLGNFSRSDLAALEHSNYVFFLWPLLSLDSLPLIAQFDRTKRSKYNEVRFSAVMTCIWATVEEHSSGRSEYADIMCKIVKDHPSSFECVFYNAAQMLMIETWNSVICDHREASDCSGLTVLEQRALLRFFILCYQRFEVTGIRRCCVQLVSPVTWLHIPATVREKNIYANNRLAKGLFERSTNVITERYRLFDKVKGIEDFSSLTDVKALYELVAPNKTALEMLNARARFLLNRDFLNSLLNHFVYILEDGIDLDAFSSADTARQTQAMQRLMLCENHMEFVIDLLSQMSTRRIIKPLFDAKLILVRCKQTPLHEHVEGGLFQSMLKILDFYTKFYIDEELGTPLHYDTVMVQYYQRFEAFQRVCYKKFSMEPTLKSVHLLSPYELQTKGALAEMLSECKSNVLGRLTMELGLFALDEPKDIPLLMKPAAVNLVPIKEKGKKAVKQFLLSVINAHLEKAVDSVAFLNGLTLYPTEELLWVSSKLPSGHDYIRLSSLALHKLNMQYLTLFDYLYSNFSLFRLESAYQIKSDLEEAIDACEPRGYLSRQKTRVGQPDMVETRFDGSHSMAIEITSLQIRKVSAQKVLKSVASYVEAEIVVDTSKVKEFQVRKDWQRLKRHDIIFLVAISAPLNRLDKRLDEYETPEEIALNLGINLVRGAEISQVLDEEGHVISDLNPYETRTPIGFRLILKVKFDYNQYIEDTEKDPNMYASMNLLVRRHSKVNNFKAVLATIRNMINRPNTLPSWLSDVFLGFGDPQECKYPKLEPKSWHMNFLDTWRTAKHFYDTEKGFLVKMVLIDGEHKDWETREIAESQLFVKDLDTTSIANVDASQLAIMAAKDCFDWFDVALLGDSGKLGKQLKKEKGRITYKVGNGMLVVDVDSDMLDQVHNNGFVKHSLHSGLKVIPKIALLKPRFTTTSQSPSKKRVVFTPAQVESIRSGVSDGITLIVGPPGTGKTDSVCQIVGILFKNNPGERTVICTHSNFALNDIFTKLVLNGHVDEHHIVRLGGSEFEIEGIGDFSKWGRVNFILQRRLDLLDLLKKLIDAIEVQGDYNFNIQLALSFFESKVLNLLRFSRDSDINMSSEGDTAGDRATSEERKKIFTRRLELLDKFFDSEIEFVQSLRDMETRWNLLKSVKATGDEDAWILHRREFIHYFYNMIKELQPFEVLRNNADRGRYLVEKYARLVAMTCTHAAIAKETMESLQYANLVMEEAAQVLEVETFVPLAHPLKRIILSGDHFQLPPVVNNHSLLKYANMQQSLFHRLIRLETPHIILNQQGRCRPEIADLFTHFYPITIENIDLALDLPEFSSRNRCFQHNVQFVDCKGTESTPIAHFYQNLEEAEFVVATYIYMRLSGYPSESIVIMCAYNGQKALVEDIVKKKCSWNPKLKAPKAIATIDKFQGRQSDYVLLSLVRTERPGHLRDPRRMLVALSRARLGLYVFGNWDIFSGCRQLMPFAEKLKHLPRELKLVPGEDSRRAVSVTNYKDMAALNERLM